MKSFARRVAEEYERRLEEHYDRCGSYCGLYEFLCLIAEDSEYIQASSEVYIRRVHLYFSNVERECGVWQRDWQARAIGAYLLAEIAEDEGR